jgi:hypothetical protein
MPNVPITINQQNIANLPSLGIPTPGPDAFGAGLGQGIASAAGTMFDAYQRVRKQRDDAAITSAYAEFAGRIGRQLNGDVADDGTVVPGALSTQGHDADGVAQKFAANLKTIDSEYQQKLTPEQFQSWKLRADVLAGDTIERLASHESRERQRGDVESYHASAMTLGKQALDSWTDSKTFNAHLHDGGEALRASLTRGGMAPDLAAARVDGWRNGLVFNRVEAAVAADRFADATELLSDPRLSTEQRGKLKDAISRQQERATSLAAAKVEHAKRMVEDGERDRLSAAMMRLDFSDPQAVADFEDTTRKSAAPHVAMAYFDQVQGMKRRVAEDMKKDAAQIQKEKADGAYRQMYRSLSTGLHVDANGALVRHSPAERVAMIEQAFAMPDGLKLDDRNALLRDVKKDSDKRAQDVTAEVFSKVVPEAKKYFATTDGGAEFRLDDNGRLVIGQDAKKKVAFDPATKLFHRTYDPGHKVMSDLTRKWSVEPAPVTEDVTLADIQDSLRVVKERMDVDPKMTVEAGVDLFRDLAGRSLDKMAKNKIQVSLREQSGLTEVMRQNLERARMSSSAVQR